MVQIPLLFWFCRNPGLALPLIALQYHEVKLQFTWGANVNIMQKIAGQSGVNCQVWCEYIYLDTDERRRFAQVSHEYLIEQVQRNQPGTTTSSSITLNFNHPVKELIWTQSTTQAAAMDGTTPITTLLSLNGHDRFAAQNSEFFRLRQPYQYHTAIPNQNLPAAGQNSLLPTVALMATTAGVHTNGQGLVNAASAQADITFVGAAGNTAIPNTTVPAAGQVIVDSTTGPTNAIVVGGVAGNTSAFNANSLRQGDIHEITVVDDSLVAGDTGAGRTTFYNTVKYICGGATATNATATVLAGGAILDATLTTAGAANQMHTGSLLVVYENSMTLPTLETAKDHTIIRKVGSKSARTSNMTNVVNVYSFALKPEEHQPSGTCNFSRIDNSQLKFSGAGAGVQSIYAVNYNVLRIMSGMGGLAYSN